MSEDKKRLIFNGLYQRYFKKVFIYVARILKYDTFQAEDITQEAFLRAYGNYDLDSMLGSSDFLRWIYTVARNLSFNHLRHMRYEPKQSLNQLVNINDDSQEALENLIADDRCRMPDEEVEKAEFLSIVWESLNRLSNDYRRVVELCCIEGFSYRQAAVALNTRESVVAHNLMRARRKLSSTVEF